MASKVKTGGLGDCEYCGLPLKKWTTHETWARCPNGHYVRIDVVRWKKNDTAEQKIRGGKKVSKKRMRHAEQEQKSVGDGEKKTRSKGASSKRSATARKVRPTGGDSGGEGSGRKPRNTVKRKPATGGSGARRKRGGGGTRKNVKPRVKTSRSKGRSKA